MTPLPKGSSKVLALIFGNLLAFSPNIGRLGRHLSFNPPDRLKIQWHESFETIIPGTSLQVFNCLEMECSGLACGQTWTELRVQTSRVELESRGVRELSSTAKNRARTQVELKSRARLATQKRARRAAHRAARFQFPAHNLPFSLPVSQLATRCCRRKVITNWFCKKLCLRTTPEVSCFVRSIEVGGWSDTIKVGPNCSDHWQMLESEHRIFAYLGHRIVSPRFLTEITMESIAVSTSTDRNENMLPNNLGLDMLSSYRFSKGKSLLNFRLSCKFCVVHEIKMQIPEVFYFCEPISSPLEILRFRLGHMKDENATPEESLLGNFVWTYVSPEFSTIETDDFQSFKLQRPVICIDGVLQIEMLSRDPAYKLPDICDSQVKAIVCPLAPAFDVNLLDRMGNSILLYFPRAVEYLDDVTAQQPPRSLRRKLWMKERRRKKKGRNHDSEYR